MKRTDTRSITRDGVLWYQDVYTNENGFTCVLTEWTKEGEMRLLKDSKKGRIKKPMTCARSHASYCNREGKRGECTKCQSVHERYLQACAKEAGHKGREAMMAEMIADGLVCQWGDACKL